MTFRIDSAVEILERTPATLTALLGGLSDEWLAQTEGPDTWNARQVVAHLIGGEKTDWIPRVEHLLEHGERKPFPPFDRLAEIRMSGERPMGELLAEFAALRRGSLDALMRLQLTSAQMNLPGAHPEFGTVYLRQHLATWATHDLTHISQIVRALAKRYAEDVGPWQAYLRVVRT